MIIISQQIGETLIVSKERIELRLLSTNGAKVYMEVESPNDLTLQIKQEAIYIREGD